MTDQTAKARDRATTRVAIGVLIAMLGIYGATHIQPSGDAATLAWGALGILIAALSLYLMASGIKSASSSSTCSFTRSNTVDQDTPKAR